MLGSTRPEGVSDRNAATPPSAQPARRRLLRRLAALAAAGAGLAMLGAALAPWLLSPQALVDEVATQLRSSAGLLLATKGRASFSPLPRPHILMEGVAFADENAGLFIEATKFVGNLAVPALLAGRLEMAAIALVRPTIVIDIDRHPLAASGAAARAAQTAPATPQAQKADQARLDVVGFVDGALRIRAGGVETAFDHLDATLDWRKIGAPATLTGSFDWHGERPQVLAWVARPGALLRGEQSPLTLRFDSDSAHISFEGLGQASPKPRGLGRVTASAPSLAQALALFDTRVPLPGRFENLRLTAHAGVGPDDLQLTDLRFIADENEFAGALSLRMEDRPRLQAELSTGFVSLKPLLADAPPLSGPDGQWRRDAFDLADLSGADVDLRLSAAHARIARLAMNDAAFSLTLHDGRLDLALAEAQAYKGRIKAQATVSAPTRDTIEMRASASTAQIDAGALLWDAAARADLSGRLDSTLTLRATGDSVAALMRDLDGHADLTLTQGELDGVNLERALRRLDKRPLASAYDIRSGRSTLLKAAATLDIAKGVAQIEEAFAQGPGFALQITGAARVAERTLAMKAIAREADSAGTPRDKGTQIAFDLSGDWSEPNFAPDAQALIKRSGAAAPLLPRLDPAEPVPETKRAEP